MAFQISSLLLTSSSLNFWIVAIASSVIVLILDFLPTELRNTSLRSAAVIASWNERGLFSHAVCFISGRRPFMKFSRAIRSLLSKLSRPSCPFMTNLSIFSENSATDSLDPWAISCIFCRNKIFFSSVLSKSSTASFNCYRSCLSSKGILLNILAARPLRYAGINWI